MASKDLWPDGRPSFGDEIRKEFYLDPKFAPCNPGSYGTTPKIVMEERLFFFCTFLTRDNENLSNIITRISHLMEVEQQPDLWYRCTEWEKYDLAVKRIATFLVKNVSKILLRYSKYFELDSNPTKKNLKLTENL